jgi:hypothetical protein
MCGLQLIWYIKGAKYAVLAMCNGLCEVWEAVENKRRKCNEESLGVSGGPLLGLETRTTFATTHDRTHKREEPVRVLGRRYRADLVL